MAHDGGWLQVGVATCTSLPVSFPQDRGLEFSDRLPVVRSSAAGRPGWGGFPLEGQGAGSGQHHNGSLFAAHPRRDRLGTVAMACLWQLLMRRQGAVMAGDGSAA